MWRPIKCVAGVMLAVGAVSAQQAEYAPAPAPATEVGASNDQAPVDPMTSVPAVPPSSAVTAQTTPVAVPKPASEVDADVAALRELQKDVARTTAEVALLQTQVQAQDARKQLQPFAKGTSDLPRLIGVFGVGDNLTAQFAVGLNVMEVAAGEWLTSDWRVARVTGLGVELTDKQGRKHTAMFGGQPERTTVPVLVPGATPKPTQYPNVIR